MVKVFPDNMAEISSALNSVPSVAAYCETSFFTISLSIRSNLSPISVSYAVECI